jgi:4-amino-4-deoxy-L-arabinose transferase-like glycosyltransferase
LNYIGLVGADEPRYAQIAREMLARHDWVTPVLGGKPWLEKPILYYWEAMLSYSIFGVSDWAARIPSAVDATLMVIAVYLFLRRFRPGFQLDGALMTASGAAVIGFARAASTDMPLAAAFTIAMLAWYGWYESKKRLYLAGFYAFLGFALLAKGPIGPCMAAAIIILFAVAKGDWRLATRTLWIPGIALFCTVGVPWYVLVQLRNPEFFRVFVLQHNFARFATDLYHHEQPFWYYVPVTLLAVIPWVVFVIVALTETVRLWWRERRNLLQTEDALNVFLLIWLLFPVLFFSFSKSKLPGYILPAIPAATVLVAEYVRRHVTAEIAARLPLILVHSIVASLPLIPALMIQYVVRFHRLPWGAAAYVSIVVALVIVVAMTLTLYSQLGLRMLRFVTLVPVVLAVAAVLKIGGPVLDERLTARPLAVDINWVEAGLLPAAVYHIPRELEYGLAFYRNQIINNYDRGEIPAGPHLLVAPDGFDPENPPAFLESRRVSLLGTYDPQHVQYFWVSGPGAQPGQNMESMPGMSGMHHKH